MLDPVLPLLLLESPVLGRRGQRRADAENARKFSIFRTSKIGAFDACHLRARGAFASEAPWLKIATIRPSNRSSMYREASPGKSALMTPLR